jgi:hypothetical protein
MATKEAVTLFQGSILEFAWKDSNKKCVTEAPAQVVLMTWTNLTGTNRYETVLQQRAACTLQHEERDG